MKCGDVIRLEHVNTNKNLHSHKVQSWITKRGTEEVSCFGRDGRGDQQDDWVIECDKKSKGDVIYGYCIFCLINFSFGIFFPLKFFLVCFEFLVY